MDVEHLKSKADNVTYDVADATARAAITELNSKLAGLVKYRNVTETTTNSGAFPIPSDLQLKPIIDVYASDANYPLFVFRRASNYFTVYGQDLTNPSPMRNTSVTLTVWYFDSSIV